LKSELLVDDGQHSAVRRIGDDDGSIEISKCIDRGLADNGIISQRLVELRGVTEVGAFQVSTQRPRLTGLSRGSRRCHQRGPRGNFASVALATDFTGALAGALVAAFTGFFLAGVIATALVWAAAKMQHSREAVVVGSMLSSYDSYRLDTQFASPRFTENKYFSMPKSCLPTY